MNPEHGTKARYLQHLRDGDTPCNRCRAANTLYQNKRRHRRKHLGPLVVDATPYHKAICAALANGVGPSELAAVCGITDFTVRRLQLGERTRMYRITADAVERGLRKLAESHVAHWTECLDHLDFTRERHTRTDPKRWPTSELHAFAAARELVLKDVLPDALRRQVYRVELLSDVEAEHVAGELGVDPETIWSTWFDLEEAS